MKQDNRITPEKETILDGQAENKPDEVVNRPHITKRSFSKDKIKKLNEEIERRTFENAQLQDKYLRLAAEFDNYKKWIGKDIENRIRNATEALVLDILPILDDLDRTIKAVSVTDNNKTIIDGIRLISGNLKQRLEKHGLEEIESLGKEFDVELHEAVMMIEDKNYSASVVAQEYQKGYKLNGRVLRHAKVVVTK